ncbi:MAG: DedA family protein [Alphaproteobacteria bacterium]|nr:DedA family protein [Alphaproteobacteria bacterium]
MFPVIEEHIRWIIAFAQTHQAWAPPIVFLLAFGESLAFVALLLPATVILAGIGAVVGAGSIDFFPIWAAAAVGAFLGDWVSYWIGIKIGPRAAHVWPLNRNPDVMARGERFFHRWGAPGVFFGRFFGPVRAVIPLVAGIFQMPVIPFQIANATSAMLWAYVVPMTGSIAGTGLEQLWRTVIPMTTGSQ